MNTTTHAVTEPPPGADHASLDPPGLRAAPPAGPRDDPNAGGVRRSARDWSVDIGLFLVAVTLGLAIVGDGLGRPNPPSDPTILLDLVAGFLGCIALWWRRRWPLGVALLLAALSTFSDMSGIAALIALFTVAVHRPTRTALAAAAANVAAVAVYALVRGLGGESPLLVGLFGVVMLALVVAAGMFVRARRQLVQALRDRAQRAEAEQRLRVEQARDQERTRIAREMHDVLAHRLSLLSMHAGALEFRPEAPPAEVARASGIIRASAHAALEDLREVIGVLRCSADGAVADDGQTRPQPTLGDLPALLEECRAAGLRITAEIRLVDVDPAPSVPGRTAYRVVQEGLTNVRKHAPGTVATVVVTGAPGEGLVVEVQNPPAPDERGTGAQHAPLPSAGTGLIGLRERVDLAGGRLEHGWTPEGVFRLRASLPWPAAPSSRQP